MRFFVTLMFASYSSLSLDRPGKADGTKDNYENMRTINEI